MVLLSICIPTYNRASLLKKTIHSIVVEPVFTKTDHVEVVISDNCSTDETEDVCREFVETYGDKIKYYKNELNVEDKNFELVLRRGNGTFLKLHNDTLCITPHQLGRVVEFISQNLEKKPNLFFLNGHTESKDDVTYCSSADSFLSHISYFSTWIGGFGMWKEDFDPMADFGKNSHLRLIQTEAIFDLARNGKGFAVFNSKIVDKQTLPNKGGFNIAEVFAQNYLSILQSACQDGILSQSTYEKEKKLVLEKHIIPMYFDFKGEYNFERNKYWYFTRDYHKDMYYYLSFLQVVHGILWPYGFISKCKFFVYKHIFKNEKKLQKYYQRGFK